MPVRSQFLVDWRKPGLLEKRLSLCTVDCLDPHPRAYLSLRRPNVFRSAHRNILRASLNDRNWVESRHPTFAAHSRMPLEDQRLCEVSMAIVIFGIPNCDTVKKARAWLDARGTVYAFHDYKKAGVDEACLRRWVAALGWETVRTLPRTAGRLRNMRCSRRYLPTEGRPHMGRKPTSYFSRLTRECHWRISGFVRFPWRS